MIRCARVDKVGSDLGSNININKDTGANYELRIFSAVMSYITADWSNIE